MKSYGKSKGPIICLPAEARLEPRPKHAGPGQPQPPHAGADRARPGAQVLIPPVRATPTHPASPGRHSVPTSNVVALRRRVCGWTPLETPGQDRTVPHWGSVFSVNWGHKSSTIPTGWWGRQDWVKAIVKLERGVHIPKATSSWTFVSSQGAPGLCGDPTPAPPHCSPPTGSLSPQTPSLHPLAQEMATSFPQNTVGDSSPQSLHLPSEAKNPEQSRSLSSAPHPEPQETPGKPGARRRRETCSLGSVEVPKRPPRPRPGPRTSCPACAPHFLSASHCI